MFSRLFARLSLSSASDLASVRLISQNVNKKDLIIRKQALPKTRNNRNSRLKFSNANNRISNKRVDDYERNFIYRGKSNAIDKDINEEDLDPEKEFELEQDLDLYSRNKNLYHKKVIEEDVKKRQRIKHGIIMKRMKKLEGNQERYLNLLTWDAKEQIKYLHLNDPDYWTVEKLTESFPITEESCRKLLRSKWAPKTLDDLSRHDQKVIENWKLLCQSENTELSGPAVNVYEEYKRTNRMALLKNACGLPDVEFQRKALIFSDSFSIHESLLVQPGKFSSLVHRNKEEMEKLFNRNKLTKQPDLEFKQEKQSQSIEGHLLLTKQELEKSLIKITSETKLNNSKLTEENS